MKLKRLIGISSLVATLAITSTTVFAASYQGGGHCGGNSVSYSTDDFTSCNTTTRHAHGNRNYEGYLAEDGSFYHTAYRACR